MEWGCVVAPQPWGLEFHLLEPTPKHKSSPGGPAKGLAPSVSAMARKPQSFCPSIFAGTLRPAEGKWLALIKRFSRCNMHMTHLGSLLNAEDRLKRSVCRGP